MSFGYCGTCLRVNLWLVNKMNLLSEYAGGTQDYQAAQTFTLRGDEIARGDSVKLSTAQAAMLIASGLVKAPAPRAPAPADKLKK